MSSHIGPDICLIVVEEYGPGMSVMRREVVPVPRGYPDDVGVPSDDLEDRRSCVELRPDDVVGTIDVRCTDDLKIVVVCALGLGDDCRDILEHVVCKHSLDKEQVVVPVDGLQYAEVVDPAVSVEVEVGHGI